jgi:predicted dithiol-disulfide oxidoreductase (DUF899 family)
MTVATHDTAREFWFETEDGPRTLEELFDGRERLLVLHFDFDADGRGLPGCVRAAEAWDRRLAREGAPDDAAFVAVSPVPLDVIVAYKWRMGWSFPWVSSLHNGFSDEFSGARPSELAES